MFIVRLLAAASVADDRINFTSALHTDHGHSAMTYRRRNNKFPLIGVTPTSRAAQQSQGSLTQSL